MRDPNRIEPFLKELGDIWKSQCPDYRFGQLIFNVFESRRENLWFTEEDRMISYFKEYFEIEDYEEEPTVWKKEDAKKFGRKRGVRHERK